jgi:hypothetical protein
MLLPTQDLLILRSQIFRNPQFTARVLGQVLLLKGFIEDGFQI